MNPSVLDGYLARLGIDGRPDPTYDALVDLHRRHVARVPYDNLDIMLGRPNPTTPTTSLERVAGGGRAGYCFHQNGALETALRELGYAVRRLHGHVWFREEHRFAPDLNHLVLEVRDLPTDANPDGRWWPDAGLGEGLPDPLPLVAGRHGTGRHTVELGDVTDDGWSYTHHENGVFRGLEVRALDVGPAAVDVAHAALSTPPEGAFTRVLAAQRVDGDLGLTVRCCVLTRATPEGLDRTDLTSYDEWRGALADELLLPLDDVTEEELRGLHARMWQAHLDWDAQGRP